MHQHTDHGPFRTMNGALEEMERYAQEVESFNHQYELAWPHHCTSCGGWGIQSWTENQSPLGSGYYWPMEMQDPCVCVEHDICPRCGRNQHRGIARLRVWLVRLLYFNVESALKRIEEPHRLGIRCARWTRKNWRAKLAYKLQRPVQRISYKLSPNNLGELLAENDNAQCRFCFWTYQSYGKRAF